MTDPLGVQLISHAEQLARTRRPEERAAASDADLRRAISAAYYALFHEMTLLVSERLTSRLGVEVRDQVRRHFTHSSLNRICVWIVNEGTLPKAPAVAALVEIARTSEWLPAVAEAFSSLQEQRHEADHDHLATVTVDDARLAVSLADDAIELLDEAARGDDEMQVDALVALLAIVGGGTKT